MMRIRLMDESGERAVLECEPGVRLSDALARLRVFLSAPCGGRGVCGKCRVRAEGLLSPPDKHEIELLGEEALARGIRLACAARALGDVRVWLCSRGGMTVQHRFDGQAASGVEGEAALAVDIGTTTLVAYLVNRETGGVARTAYAENPQRAFGADVISRVGRALAGDENALRDAVRDAVAGLARTLCEGVNVTSAVVCGNTAMLYLFADVSPAPLAGAPFLIQDHLDCVRPAEGLISALPGMCPVYLPACVSAFVGADIACAMHFAALDGESSPALLFDVGTNGEIALYTGRDILCCSTAAGPAFEGAGISMGGAALEGAIDRVSVEGNALACHVLGGRAATHVCGSGLLDAVAALLELECILPGGRLDEARLRALRLWDGQGAALRDGVRVTQADIRAVQLAKAAICAGALTLIQAAGLTPKDVARVYLAGGFGTAMRLESAERVGLLPEGFAARAKALGNAAGAGAVLLCDESARAYASRRARAARTLDLNTDPRFMKEYVRQMSFGACDEDEDEDDEL